MNVETWSRKKLFYFTLALWCFGLFCQIFLIGFKPFLSFAAGSAITWGMAVNFLLWKQEERPVIDEGQP